MKVIDLMLYQLMAFLMAAMHYHILGHTVMSSVAIGAVFSITIYLYVNSTTASKKDPFFYLPLLVLLLLVLFI